MEYALFDVIAGYMTFSDEEKKAFYTKAGGFTALCSYAVSKKTLPEYTVSCVEGSIVAVFTPDMEQAVF